MELYKAFYWPGGIHPQDTAYPNCKHDNGWYWLTQRENGKVCLASWQKYNPATGLFDKATKKQAIRAASNDAKSRHWRRIWQAAYENMPHRIQRIPKWINCEPGTTKLTDFIAGEVGGKYRMNHDGNVVQKIVYKEEHYGRQCALARCVGFVLSKNGRTPNHNWVHNSMSNGAMPRDPARRERLLELAGENGKQKAYEILTELKIRHWYV